VDPELGKYFNVPKNAHGDPIGALVSDVLPGGPAKKAAIEPGDVVLKYGDQDVANASQFNSLVGKTQAGSLVKIELLHSGKNLTKDVKIVQQPYEPKPIVQEAGQVASPSFGLAVDDVPVEISHFLKMPTSSGALVIGVSPGSPAFDSGLMPGDIILKAGQMEIHGAKHFKKVAKQLSHDDKDKDGITVLYVQRGPEEKIFVPVKGSA
jgi:serine protease Do